MNFRIEVFASDVYARLAASVIGDNLPATGSLVLTGGGTAKAVYEVMGAAPPDGIAELEILYSDERCVPPDDAESNYGMTKQLLLDPAGVPAELVHRMRGEDPPDEGADRYHDEIKPLVERGLDLMLLGMGADAHVGAMFPGSPGLSDTERLCRAVDRPDGMQGLTLTPPAMLSAKKILLLVTGEAKAQTVARVVKGNEPVSDCPARIVAPHSDATFLLDEAAASAL